MNGEKSARDVQSCRACFVQIELLEFEILGRTKCWLEVSLCFSGSGVFSFLKCSDTTEAVQLSADTTFISRAGLFSFCCGNTAAVYQGLLQICRLCNNKTVSGALASMALTVMWQRHLLVYFWSISGSSEMSGACPEEASSDHLLLLAVIFSRVISVPPFDNSVESFSW